MISFVSTRFYKILNFEGENKTISGKVKSMKLGN